MTKLQNVKTQKE